MAMSQPTLKAAIKAAFVANIPSPTSEQIEAFDSTAGAIATAVIDCIESATLTYTIGLIAPSGGGPVTGVMTGVTIS
jgi:hypothetical protein